MEPKRREGVMVSECVLAASAQCDALIALMDEVSMEINRPNGQIAALVGVALLAGRMRGLLDAATMTMTETKKP